IAPALAADQAVGAMAAAQRFQRVTDLHGTILIVAFKGRGSRPNLNGCQNRRIGILPGGKPPGNGAVSKASRPNVNRNGPFFGPAAADSTRLSNWNHWQNRSKGNSTMA